jgi:hypothetical protein
MGMDSRLTTILRRPDGLFGIVSRRRAAFERPMPPKEVGDGFVLSAPETGPYVEEIRPLADVSDALAHGRRLLLQSWQALESVTIWNAEVLANVLHVLIGTIADPAADVADVPALVVSEPVTPPRPTAAHPRAYQGTKYKPPKPPRPEPVDLRPHLCRAADESRVLERLSPHFDAAVARVERDHPYGEVLRSYGTESLRPYAQCWMPACHKDIAALPAGFRRSLLWSLRGCAWEHVSAALAAWWALGLAEDDRLRCCVSTLLSLCPMRQIVDWCHVIAQMPPHRRIHFTELLIETSAYHTVPDVQITDGLARADRLSSDAVYRHRMHYALCSVAEKASLGYANDGFALANAYQVDHVFKRVASTDGVAPAVKRFAEYVADAEDWWSTSAMMLWERCAELDGLRELLDDPGWRRLDAQSACKLVHILSDVVYEELDDETLEQKWRFLRDHARSLRAWLNSIVQAYRPKALRHIGELIWIWDDDVDGLRTVLEPYKRLITRLCAQPFAESGYEHNALPDLTFAPMKRWNEIEQAPDESFLKLEAATRRENDAWLIGRGLRCLVHRWPEFAISALERFPAKLARTSLTLGPLSSASRDGLVASFRKHPLVIVDEDAAELRALATLAKECRRPGIVDPVPRRFKEHLRGRRSLRPAQVERDAALIREGWLALQLDVLNQIAYDEMSTGLPEAKRSSEVRHALMLQQAVEEHRRSLRRLLRACLSGQRGYAEDHPKNREWLARHPRLDPSKWLQGVSCRRDVSGHGVLDLSIEQDALEVLRLGSHFGTCLGVGGRFSYSAAAIALDINKRVVYARTAAGRVVARQLLAVSEDDRLICFTVYPQRIGMKVRTVFKEFDMRFATHLGIGIYEPTDDDERDNGYKIASIVSRSFWDDDAWDLNTKDE